MFAPEFAACCTRAMPVPRSAAMAASHPADPVSDHVWEYLPAAETTWYAASIFACGCCAGPVNAVHQPAVMLPVSPPTEMRRSVALAVAMAGVWMGLAGPVAVSKPSSVPAGPAHSETIELRSPGEGAPIRLIVSVAEGLPPTVPYAITVFSRTCDQM